ncbi:DUF1752-domain-containing protein [Xylona heveae TC161]|uniref:DUF1752-domain-containing protein n=1 Tax=Xylona heveae (strain CBS 132557 / TC161) TaxID=1328760 RepID=A0A165GRQ1_XYLHT|nr:DUF1752-domain-containing protein [Xylona heveae TC161]KZF22510.1 DUF1752-domain-containing protein [Xylona heveae TC161]
MYRHVSSSGPGVTSSLLASPLSPPHYPSYPSCNSNHYTFLDASPPLHLTSSPFPLVGLLGIDQEPILSATDSTSATVTVPPDAHQLDLDRAASVEMAPRLAAPVLTVDAAKIHKVDTRNAENLFSMWTVFSKCADSMEEGRRLENLSWRLWNRETFCCEPESVAQPSTSPMAVSHRLAVAHESEDVPELSGSVDSAASDDCMQSNKNKSAPLDIQRPKPVSRDSDRSRGRERHITSLDLEKMVMNIKEKKELEPLEPFSVRPAPLRATSSAVIQRPSSPRPSVARAATAPQHSTVSQEKQKQKAADIDSEDDDNTGSQSISTHSIVRGFSPGQISSSVRSQPQLQPQSIVPARPPTPFKVEQKKKGGMFMLGASSGEEESSLEEHMSQPPHRSSLSDGLRKPGSKKKQTSFKEEVATRTILERAAEDEDVFESDDEEDVSESAIEDDDDSSDWEDSVTESARSSMDDKQMFQRVDSRPHLTSRRSLLTNLLHQPQRAAAMQNIASRSTPALHRSRTSSPNGPSVAGSPEDESALTMRGVGIPRSKPIGMNTSNTQPPALSPRTTRRNMLATELTESLRRHLLWERQQKSTTANAVLKRRHTAHDVANLQEYPGQRSGSSKDASKTGSWNQYFDHGLGEYHQKGW